MTVSKTARTVLLFTYVHLPTHITHCHPLHEVDSPVRATSPEGEEMLSEQDDEETIEDDNPEPDSTSLR